MPTPTESARGRDWADLTARGRVVYQTAITYKGMGGTAGGRKRLDAEALAVCKVPRPTNDLYYGKLQG